MPYDALASAVAMRAQIKKLRIALQPFAKAAAFAEPDEKDSYCVSGSSARHALCLGDLRRARAALGDGYRSDDKRTPDQRE